MACKEKHSVWNCALLCVLLCLFNSIAVADPSIVIQEANEEKKVQEGSCVTIICNYKPQSDMQLLWIKNPIWNQTKKKFDGNIVYSNTQERPQVPEYADRVEFLNRDSNTHWATCTLEMYQLKKNDSGNYTFRYITKTDKYLSETFILNVTDNPCKVHIKPLHLNKSLKEGDNVSLHCVTSAACKYNPEWQLSDSRQVFSTMHTEEKCSELNLTVSWRDDGETLTCRPSEQHETCLYRSVTLRVEYAPKETKVSEGSSKDVKEGEGVTISCSSKAHPNAKFTWFKHDSDYSQSGDQLILQNMKPEDEGKFYCRAENQHGGENSSDIKVNVVYAPKGVDISHSTKYSGNNNSIELFLGMKLTLTCSVQSSNPAVAETSYKWYKDSQELHQQQTATFTVEGVTRFDKGKYDCSARNLVGETKSTNSSHVIVKYAPQDTHIQSISNQVKLDHMAELKCVTEAYPSPEKFFWYFKPEKEMFYTFLDMAQTYLIQKVAVNDAGEYMCCAQNSIGRGENSTLFKFTVLYPPKTPNLTMKEVVKENEFYTITCTVESSPPSFLTLIRSSLSNTKGERLKLNKVMYNFVEFAGTASVLDAGEYICEAKNSEGRSLSKRKLVVLYAPKNVIASAHPGMEQMEGSYLALTCKADSVPQVSTYTWKKLGHTSGTQSVGKGQTITFLSLNRSDSDYYFCIASNNIGSSESSSIHIRVKHRPHIMITHNMTSLSLWEKATPIQLSCSVQCYPPATLFAWYKLEENTTSLSSDQNYTVQPENPGTYYCDAENEVGKSGSDPVEIYLNYFIIKRLITVILSFVVIILLIGVIYLLQRIILSKRSSGKNSQAQRSFFFSPTPLCSFSNMRSPVSRNNTRENLVMDGSTELSDFRDNYSPTAVHANPPANRNKQAGRPNSNVTTVYDAIKLPPSTSKQQHHKKEDLNLTTVNYAVVQYMDSNNPNKSVPSQDGCEAIYTKVAKNKPMPKERKGGHEDYENVSGACAPKRPFPNIDWDSDSSESEDEVNYTQVSFTATSHHNPQKNIFGLDEDKIEYSEVKI